MYDLHSHILPGVDDGAETMDHSVRMARVAADNGTKTVVATPHRKDVTEGFSVGHLHELVAQFKTQLASEKVGLHVPNCELFAGRSRYRERASRPRLAPYEPPAHRVGGSSTLSRAVPSLQQRTAKTPPIFDAVPLQRQDRTWGRFILVLPLPARSRLRCSHRRGHPPL